MSRRLLAGLAASLLLVPAAALRAQSARDNPHGNGLQIDCGECHSPERWTPVDKPPTFQHGKTGFALDSAHARVSCRDCHRTLVFNQIGTACADCHKDAHRGELGARCETCHTPTTWTNQREMFLVHSRTRFPLFVSHARLDCTACHRNQNPTQYKLTPAECGNCHLTTFAATTNPSHVQGGFSRRCEDCHNTTSPTWQGAAFEHPASFPLAGRHAGITCVRCHPGRVYTGTSPQCASCHRPDYDRAANPNHVASGFPMQCENCHTIQGWRPAIFDHSQTRFALTGAHTRTDCAKCHPGGKYTGTPSDCYACHQANYNATTNPNHVAGRFSTRCTDCHNTGAWKPANFDHSKTRFPLNGAHERLDCAKCHPGGKYTGTPLDCYACHSAKYAATTSPNHTAAGFGTACQTCHTTAAWKPASFDHSSKFALTGAHTRTDCAKCHPGGRYTGTPKDCYSCHQAKYAATTNPNHAASGFPTQCQTCHNTSAWKPASFDHNQTRFALTGAHSRTDCAKCHPGGRYTGTPTDCYSCHQAKYNATTNPNHASAGYPTQCQNCHSTSAWKPASVNHNQTKFPLTGAHTAVACAKCHVGGKYTGTPTDCFSCHQAKYNATTSPNHASAGYSTQCQTCHTTSAWKPATFSHTKFPLTGAHTSVDCAKCHVGGRYAGTPSDCWSCHQAKYNATTNPNHASAGFPTACQTCHSTSAWKPSTFNHDGPYFPIYSGTHRGRWTSCGECHNVPSNFKAFECILCHAHSNKTKVDSDHKGEKGYVYASASCYSCHRTGKAQLFRVPRRLP